MKADCIRIETRQVGGRKILDLRWCLVTPSGGVVPTKRGFSVPIDLTGDLVEKISKANGAIQFLTLPVREK